MNKPIGVRLDRQTRLALEKDAKKSGVAVSTHANKILCDWFDTYKPALDGGSILFPIPVRSQLLSRVFHSEELCIG